MSVQILKRIEAYYRRPCAFNQAGEIVFSNGNPAGYVASQFPYAGFFVDTTGDADKPVFKVAGL